MYEPTYYSPSQDINVARFWTICNKSTQTCERNAIKIDERKNSQIYVTSFIDYNFSFKIKKKIKRSNIYFLRKFIMGDITYFQHSEVTRTISHNFSSLSSGSCAKRGPRRLCGVPFKVCLELPFSITLEWF